MDTLDTIEREHPSIIVLVTNDDVKLSIPYELAKQSAMISTAVSMLDSHSNEIRIPSISSKYMNMIIKWLQMNEGVTQVQIPQPLTSIHLRDFMTESNAQFFESMKLGDLFRVTESANYLDIPHLFAQACSTIASLIKKQTESSMREILSTMHDSYIKDIKLKYVVN